MADLDQVDGDGPELARRFYLEEMIPLADGRSHGAPVPRRPWRDVAEVDQMEGHSPKLADVRLERRACAAAEASRRARRELLAGRRGTSSPKSTAALRLD